MFDKESIRQILGCLMKSPQLLSQVDKYNFKLSDFSNKFEKYIFSAINGLYYNGSKKITIVDVENYLNTDDVAKTIFNQYNGIEYLEDAIEFSNLESFDYYYNRLKKFNLLNELKKKGYDTSKFYIEDLTNEKAFEVNDKFEDLTIKDIIDDKKTELVKLETEYVKTEEVKVESAAEGLDDLLEEFQDIDIGIPIQGKIYNQVINGAEKGTLTIRSSSSGLGKTRNAVADACYLAYPIRYNFDTCMWEQKGNNEKILFVITEQTFKQIKKMILAYITDINESKFKYNNFTLQEKVIIKQAVNLIKEYEENFIIIQIPNPSIEIVKAMIRENCLIRDIDYVFYDYIFISPNLLKEFRGSNLRNDELLLLMTTALKNLAVELNVGIFTSTQVNANADDNRNIRNEASLAGGRATINKADNGAIMARPTKEELESLHDLIQIHGQPNLVTDIFKVRSGQWTQVRIWSIVDLGVMRKKDLFITDSLLNAIEGFYDMPEYEIVNWDNEEQNMLNKKVEKMNEEMLNELR